MKKGSKAPPRVKGSKPIPRMATLLKKGTGKSKYRNVRTEVDGIVFDSKREAERYGHLKLLQKVGSIRGLRLQVPYSLKVNDCVVCEYIADFVYEERHLASGEWREVVEDCKGVQTDVFKLKSALMRAIHKICIRLS